MLKAESWNVQKPVAACWVDDGTCCYRRSMYGCVLRKPGSRCIRQGIPRAGTVKASGIALRAVVLNLG